MTILIFLYTGIYTYLYRISSLIRGLSIRQPVAGEGAIWPIVRP